MWVKSTALNSLKVLNNKNVHQGVQYMSIYRHLVYEHIAKVRILQILFFRSITIMWLFQLHAVCWTIMMSINNLFLLIVARLGVENACVMATYIWLTLNNNYRET